MCLLLLPACALALAACSSSPSPSSTTSTTSTTTTTTAPSTTSTSAVSGTTSSTTQTSGTLVPRRRLSPRVYSPSKNISCEIDNNFGSSAITITLCSPSRRRSRSPS